MRKPKLLLITPSLPYPLSDGAKVAQFGFLGYLIKDFDVTIFVIITNDSEKLSSERLQQLIPEISYVLFDGRASRRNVRLNNVFNSLHVLKGLILGVKSNEANPFENPSLISPIPQKGEAVIEAISQLVSNQVYDLIQIDLIQFLDLRSILPKDTKVIYVHHELRFITLRELQKTKIHSISFSNYVIERVKKIEQAYLEAYDRILVFSEDDKEKLSNIVRSQIIKVSPFPVLEKDFYSGGRDFKNIKRLLFIGGEFHYPNKEGVLWFINEIFPLLNNPDLEVFIIGDWSKSSIEKHTNKKIKFLGYVDDIDRFFENSIFICPIQIGSGIRTKVLQAMAKQIPIVTTSIGCEGLFLENNFHCLVSDSPIDFKISIERLLESQELCDSLVSNAFIHVKSKFTQEACYEIRKHIYLSTIENDFSYNS